MAIILPAVLLAGIASGGVFDMPTVAQFLNLGVKQAADRDHYVLGAAVNLSDDDPDRFDCSGLVEWSLGRLGINLPRPAQDQFFAVRDAGLQIPVARALQTPGALLFKKGPTSGSRPRPIYHVGISLGNGDVLEAKGSKWGVVITRDPPWSDAGKQNVWNLAGLAPGLDYGGSRPALWPLAFAPALYYLLAA